MPIKALLTILILAVFCYSQTINYSGTVKTSNGQAVQGATVTVCSTDYTVTTDASGDFTITGPAPATQSQGTVGISPHSSAMLHSRYQLNSGHLYLPAKAMTVSISTLNGRQVTSQAVTNRVFDLSQWFTNGLYHVNVTYGSFDEAFSIMAINGRYFMKGSNYSTVSAMPLAKTAPTTYTMFVSKSGYTRHEEVIADTTASGIAITLDTAKYAKLSRVFAKLDSGQDITLGFLGGSILYGAYDVPDVAKNETHSNRALFTKYMEGLNTKGTITAVDATIGGLDSRLAVFRMDKDLLVSNPDITILEYAINQGGEECLESIIRKLYQNNPDMAVVLVIYGVQNNGWITNNTERQAHLNLCSHYGIPCVDIYDEVKNMISSGETSLSYIFPGSDKTHPKDDGHQLYFEIMRDKINLALKTSGIPKAYPSAKTNSRYEKATMIELGALSDLGDWQLGTRTLGLWLDQDPQVKFNSVVTPTKSNADITVGTYDMTMVGLYFEAKEGGQTAYVRVGGTSRLTVGTEWMTAWNNITQFDGKAVVRYKISGFGTYNGEVVIRAASSQGPAVGYFMYVAK